MRMTLVRDTMSNEASAARALIASSTAGQIFNVEDSLFLIKQTWPALAAGSRTPFVPSAAETKVNPVPTAVASACVEPAAATVLLSTDSSLKIGNFLPP